MAINFNHVTNDISASSGSVTVNGSAIGGTAASQAEMEAGSSTSVFVTPGRQQYHQSAAKGWVKADAAGNIKSSYNVTSISDTGVGRMTITWNVDFSSAEYVCVGVVDNAASGTKFVVANGTEAVGTIEVRALNTSDSAADPGRYYVVAFGDQ